MACLYICCLLLGLHASAQEVLLLKTIPMQARILTVDELGNMYVVRNDNTLLRYTENGDSSLFYRSVQNGDIGMIDATNPLRVVVYYPAFSKIVLLDRMLAVKNELDLRKINIISPPVVATSADGNLWVYDKFNARLRKIDEQLAEVGQSNDLRQQTATAPNPVFMIERERKLYLCDTLQGIFTFDQYGTYINTLTIFGVKRLQVYGPQLIYRHGDTMLSYDMQRIREKQLVIPTEEHVIDAAMHRNKLWVLYADRVCLYQIPEEKN